MMLQQTKSQVRAMLEVQEIFRELNLSIETEEVAAILTLAAIINMNSKPIYIVTQDERNPAKDLEKVRGTVAQG